MWLVGQWASIHFEHSRNELALAEFTMLCSSTRHLTLTKPHSSNNISFGGLGGTLTCQNKTPVFNCEDHFHFQRFCLFYFFKRSFLVRHRRNLAILLKIRATFRLDCEQSLFFFRFSESNARAQERRSRETRETRTDYRKKRVLLVVYFQAVQSRSYS